MSWERAELVVLEHSISYSPSWAISDGPILVPAIEQVHRHYSPKLPRSLKWAIHPPVQRHETQFHQIWRIVLRPALLEAMGLCELEHLGPGVMLLASEPILAI